MFSQFVRRSYSQGRTVSRAPPRFTTTSRSIKNTTTQLTSRSVITFATSVAIGSTILFFYSQTSSADSKNPSQSTSQKPEETKTPRNKLREPSDPKKEPIVLIACGSFSPITSMHLRLLEMTKDYFNDNGYEVVGGYYSPVSDKYNKSGLESAAHRVKMVELASETSDWIMVDSWEAQKSEYTRTVEVLHHFDEVVNKNRTGKPVRIVFACGSDLLDSFTKPGVWSDQDIIDICTKYGVGVVTREGSNPERAIWSNDLLYSLRRNIHIIHQWIPNDISSTRVRLALSRGLSVKYLVPDATLDYIKKNNLYDSGVKSKDS